MGNNVVPIHYVLKFDTDIKSFKFRCDETIFIKVKNTTNSIDMNSRELNIKKAYLIYSGKKIAANIEMDKKLERVRFKFTNKFRGNLELHIEAFGTNNYGMYGFYRSTYIHNGKKKWLLSSQFEAADARSAFVCFDEPEFKASFDIFMVTDTKLKAISNMPIKSEHSLNKKRKVTEFEKTPKMSPYLLYLGVGEFQTIHMALGKLKLNAVTVPGKANMAKMALGFCKKFVDFYQNYFGINFPLPKIDIIAVPDFSAGAMENWGAITFREVEILGDPKKTSVFMKQRIAEVMAHELAHQWFGDLVTMKWWNDLWLNESFATFMSYKAMDAVFPKWDMKTQYYMDIMSPAFNVDSRKTTHPIIVNVDTPEQINSIFDGISYNKGGTVLHMLESYAGEKAFKKGLHNYLKKHEYGNAEGDELWEAIDKEVKLSKKQIGVADFAKRWITQIGHPIVDVDIIKNKIKLSQNRFSISGILKSKETWNIPLDYTIGTNKKIIKKNMEVKDMYLERYTKPIKLNHNQNYMYRVRYETLILDGLGAYIKNKTLGSVDAWGIENDLFVLARSGNIKLDLYLEFIEKYYMDVDYPSNQSISEHLGWLLILLYGTNRYKKTSEIALNFHKTLIKKLGWTESKKDTNIDPMLRNTAISYLGILGDKMAVSRMNALYNKLLKGISIDENILTSVLRVITWNGDEKIFNQIVRMYEKEKFPETKMKLLYSIGMFRRESLIKKGLKFALSNHIKLQDIDYIPFISSESVIGYPIVWKWMKKNWPMLLKKISVGTHMLQRFTDIARLMHFKDEGLDFHNFFASKKNRREDIEKEVREISETIDANIKFFKVNGINNNSD